MLGNYFVHDLMGSPTNGHDAIITVESFHQVTAHKPVAAKNLGSIEGEFVANHAGKILSHGNLLYLVLPGIDLSCYPIGELSTSFHKGCHFCQFVTGDLKTGNGFSKQGLIFRMARPGTRKNEKTEWLYNLLPVAEGMWEFQMNSTGGDTVVEVNAYIEYFMQNAWYNTKTSQHRVIPISQSIPAGMEILPYDHVERIIQSQTKIALAPCVCRKQADMLGKGCDHPLEVCMAFGTGAYYYIENGLGRDVSIEEALDVLRKGMAAGLVPQPGNGQRVWGICMCCSCGCQLLRALKKMEKPAQLAHTNFYATCEDENCTACGTCVERCPMAAIELEDTAMVNRDRCIGCGVCVAACEVDAMVLHAKQEKEQYVPPRDIVDMQKRIAQERRLLQE